MNSCKNALFLSMFLMMAILCLFLPPEMCQAAVGSKGVPETEKFTEAELQAAYDSLSEQDKKLIDNWSSDERTRHLKTRAMYNRLRAGIPVKSTQKPDAQEPPEKYELDPSLKKAYLAYMDDSCPREKVIDLFNQYIEKNPESKFLPEIYFRIGALYCIHRKKDSYEPKLAAIYYEKAHKLYGDKFSYLHRSAWASLGNWPFGTLEIRKSYYDWLRKLQKEISPENIYPIREIGQTLNGRQPVIDVNDRYLLAKSIEKTNIASFIDSAEKNIYWRSSNNYRDLIDLAKSYPDTKLGKQAEARLKEMDEFFLEGLELEAEPIEPNSEESVQTVGENNNSMNEKMDTPVTSNPIEKSVSPVVSSGRPKMAIVIGSLGLCFVAGVLVWTWRRKQPVNS